MLVFIVITRIKRAIIAPLGERYFTINSIMYTNNYIFYISFIIMLLLMVLYVYCIPTIWKFYYNKNQIGSYVASIEIVYIETLYNPSKSLILYERKRMDFI